MKLPSTKFTTMEKILLAVDAIKPNINVLDFACYVAAVTGSKITGVFLENLQAVKNKELAFPGQGDEMLPDDGSAIEEIEACCEDNIKRFREACENRDVRCDVHRDRSVPAEEMIEESRFADLIIVDAETSFNKKYEGAPTKFVKDVLAETECPVIVAPYSFTSIDEIVFTYDGSKSSVFAIKLFTYLLPELSDKKITILQINKENDKTIKEKYKLKEWLKEHYNSIGFAILEGDSKRELFDYLLHRKNTLVVMGAYGRNLLSEFFTSSHADLILKVINVPVFIAHY